MTDVSILSWANAKLRAVDPSLKIRSFSDVTLESGVLLLTLLGAVAPECVQAGRIPSRQIPGSPSITPQAQPPSRQIPGSASITPPGRILVSGVTDPAWTDV